MELPTKRTSGKINVQDIRMVICGPPKIGKTNLCSGWPNALFGATEKGYKALQVFKVDIKSWKGFKKFNDKVVDGKHEFRTIVIDTVDMLWKYCVEQVCNDLNIDHVSDEDWGKGYDMVSTEFENELNRLFMTDYGIILVSHTKTSDMYSSKGRSSKTTSSLSNQARRVLIPKVDVIGIMSVKTVKNSDGSYKDKRVISFRHTENEEGGDRTGRLPEQLTVYKDAQKTYELFESFFKKSKKEDD